MGAESRPRLTLPWPAALFAVFSLTLIRMLPVAAFLVGTNLNRASVAFMGWFGPRGPTTIVLTAMVVKKDAYGNRSRSG
jgi:NhaP-type Na+/H+ or K+/H+ antiporter